MRSYKKSNPFLRGIYSLKQLFFRPTSLIIVFACVALFLTFSLATYNVNDISCFNYSSSGVVTNMCAAMGSHAASLVLYLFGMSAWFIVCCLAYVVLYFIRREYLDNYYRDLLMVFTILPFITAAGCSWYKLEWYQGIYPGGLFGSFLVTSAIRLFDYWGATFLLHGFFVILAAFAFPVFFMRVLAAMRQLVFRIFSMQTVLSIGYCIKKILYELYRLCFHLLRFALRAMSGSIDVLGNEQSVIAFEQTILHSSSEDEETVINGAKKIVRGPLDVPVKKTESADIKNAMHKEVHSQKTPEIEQKVSVKIPKAVAYTLPNTSVFEARKKKLDENTIRTELQERARTLEQKLERFGVYGNVTAIKEGPVVTLFEYQPKIDTKISKIISLEDDLAMALQALSIRIIAPIPGRSVVGFEVANKTRTDVLFADLARSKLFYDFKGAIPLILGEDTVGNQVVVDLAKMPHLLVAGSTGSGKSVALNAMLISLLCKMSPEDLKLILFDPKRLEFAPYADIPHLLFPIVTDPKRAAPVLKWVVQQMEQRYELMAEHGVRNINDYNKAAKNSLDIMQVLPMIVVVIDELADLMMTAARDVEDLIARVAQMARAAGIHMILATQRPSVDVITGLIKVNFPSRISFRVTSKVDSRTILDCGGADKLLGRGDMLFLDSSSAMMRRVHGAYVSDKEIEMVVNHVRAQAPARYLDICQELMIDRSNNSDETDQLYSDVRAYVASVEEVSISLLQRKFRIGYNRSARIIDMLESQGVIMPSENGKTRKVIR